MLSLTPPASSGLATPPGFLAAAAVAGIALLAGRLPGLGMASPLILAIVTGMLIGNILPMPARLRPGLTFAQRRLLRLGIVLLGLQITVSQVVAVGVTGLTIVAAALVSTFLFTLWLGRWLGVEAGLTRLIAAGTAICGASAVVATSTVVTARDEDVTYAVAVVTVFGSLSMALYPPLQHLVGLSADAFGLWAGVSIHEVAQAVATAFQGGQASGEMGTISKLARVLLLVPVVLALGAAGRRRGDSEGGGPEGGGPEGGGGRPPLPWFAFGFMAVVGVNSLGLVPELVRGGLVAATPIVLSIAMAAMGLETRVHLLWRRGVRPLLLGAGAWLFISLFSLSIILATVP